MNTLSRLLGLALLACIFSRCAAHAQEVRKVTAAFEWDDDNPPERVQGYGFLEGLIPPEKEKDVKPANQEPPVALVHAASSTVKTIEREITPGLWAFRVFVIGKKEILENGAEIEGGQSAPSDVLYVRIVKPPAGLRQRVQFKRSSNGREWYVVTTWEIDFEPKRGFFKVDFEGQPFSY